jgi:transposase
MADYKRYSKELKLQAARLVSQQGYSYREVAQRLGVPSSSVRYWVASLRKKGQLPAKDQTHSVAEQLRMLRNENTRLEMENEILKKAAAYFAKESL